MPQEIRAVQCFECKIYQVDLVKKSKKWTCKVCNVKQSLRAELFRGSGPACRARVQELNKQRELNAQNGDKLELEFAENFDHDEAIALEQYFPQPTSRKLVDKKVISKWTNFVVEERETPAVLKGNSNKPQSSRDNLPCFQNTLMGTMPESKPTSRNIKRSSGESAVGVNNNKHCKWDSYV